MLRKSPNASWISPWQFSSLLCSCWCINKQLLWFPRTHTYIDFQNDHVQAVRSQNKVLLLPPAHWRSVSFFHQHWELPETFHFFPMPIGCRREVLMNSLSVTMAFLDCTNLNDTSVALGVYGCECASVLPLLNFRQLGSWFQNCIHELTSVLQF